MIQHSRKRKAHPELKIEIWKITKLAGSMALRNSLGTCKFEYAPLELDLAVCLSRYGTMNSIWEQGLFKSEIFVFPVLLLNFTRASKFAATRTSLTIDSNSATTPVILIPFFNSLGEMFPMLPFNYSLAIYISCPHLTCITYWQKKLCRWFVFSGNSYIRSDRSFYVARLQHWKTE